MPTYTGVRLLTTVVLALAAGAAAVSFTEEEVGTLGPFTRVSRVVCSGDGRAFVITAAVERKVPAGKQYEAYVITPEGQSGPYDLVYDEEVTAEGDGLAYSYHSEGSDVGLPYVCYRVINGRAYGPYAPLVLPIKRTFGASGSWWLAGHAWDGDIRYGKIIVNGKGYGPYEEMGPVAFSPDGAHWGCYAKNAKGWLVLIDGNKKGMMEYPGGLDTHFSLESDPASALGSTGATPAFARTGEWGYTFWDDGAGVLIKNQLYGPFAGFGNLKFAADGAVWGVGIIKNRDDPKSAYALINGVEYGPFKTVANVWVAPKGGEWVYAAEKDDGWCMITRNAEVGPHGFPGYSTFSPDGARLAYIAKTFTGSDATKTCYFDGKPFGPYDRVETLTFSPDGASWAALVGAAGGKWFWLVDGVEYPLSGFPDREHKIVFGSSAKKWIAEGARGEVITPAGSVTGYEKVAVFGGDELGFLALKREDANDASRFTLYRRIWTGE